MLEAVYATYLLVWMDGVIFIAGSAAVAGGAKDP